ncbi:nucleotide excision repair endonuclease [Bacillus sp. Brlt_9]|uniref:nucleotide excision repair endonuclease n=1 Tax=Bacillus sp. Brlt_9 TaxID=3110916 RepID=UPI003F7B4820
MSFWTKKVEYKRTDLYIWERKILQYITKSGVYVFRDVNDEIIYVGEATNLAKRVNTHLAGNSDTSALYEDDAFSYTHKVELYELKTEDTHERKLIELDLIQRFNPVFNRNHRTNGTPKQIESMRKVYLKQNSAYTWKNWSVWQIKAFIEGDVLTDFVLMSVENETNTITPYPSIDSWENEIKDKLINRIMKKQNYKDPLEVINKAFSIGLVRNGDYNLISPVSYSLHLTPFSPKFLSMYAAAPVKLINILQHRKNVGQNLAPTNRRTGDPHPVSEVQTFI